MKSGLGAGLSGGWRVRMLPPGRARRRATHRARLPCPLPRRARAAAGRLSRGRSRQRPRRLPPPAGRPPRTGPRPARTRHRRRAVLAAAGVARSPRRPSPASPRRGPATAARRARSAAPGHGPRAPGAHRSRPSPAPGDHRYSQPPRTTRSARARDHRREVTRGPDRPERSAGSRAAPGTWTCTAGAGSCPGSRSAGAPADRHHRECARSRPASWRGAR